MHFALLKSELAFQRDKRLLDVFKLPQTVGTQRLQHSQRYLYTTLH